MKALFSFTALVILVAATPGVGFAMMSIEPVTKDRAKALGLEVRSSAAGPDVVRVELEFETKGELKNYSRVDLELREDGKLLTSSTLKEDRSKPGRVVVGLAADRAKLDRLTLRVVVEHGARTRTGYDIKVTEFVDPAPGPNDRRRVTDPEGKPVTAGVQGYVSDVDAMAFPGRPAVCSATVSVGKLGAGEQTPVYATDPLLQAALVSAAERQVLVEVQYHPEVVPAPAPADAQSNRVVRVRLLDQPKYQPAAEKKPITLLDATVPEKKPITLADTGADAKPLSPKLWAGVSVSSPNALFTVAEAKGLMIGFALVNDGADAVPFERGDVELVVNGKPLAGFGAEFREGPIWASLVPGKPCHAAVGVGKHFTKPGLYKVQWRVKGVESAVLEFRVMGE